MKDVAKSAASERRAEIARRQVLRNAIADDIAQPLPHLTDRQASCLRWIFDSFVTNLAYPTRWEITERMGMQSTSTQCNIRPPVNGIWPGCRGGSKIRTQHPVDTVRTG